MKPKQVLRRLVIGAASLYGLGIGARHGYDYWRVYDIFRETFSTSYFSVHRLTGDEGEWMSYVAWISFVSDEPPRLRHPADYHQVPCTLDFLKAVSMMTNYLPFAEGSPNLLDQIKGQKRYEAYWKKLETVLPELRCMEGKANFYPTPNGILLDAVRYVYRPRDGLVLVDLHTP